MNWYEMAASSNMRDRNVNLMILMIPTISTRDKKMLNNIKIVICQEELILHRQ